MTDLYDTFTYGELIVLLKDKDTVPSSELLAKAAQALVDLEVKVRVQTYYAGRLREGLQFYAPGPFWTEVLKDTRAAEDQGKHAEWILRLTDPDAA